MTRPNAEGNGLVSVFVDPLKDQLWEGLTRGSSLFLSPPWLRAVALTYGYQAEACVLLEGEEPVAGFPFCRISDVRGDRTVAFPFSDYCDPAGVDLDTWQRLSRPLPGERVYMRTLRTNIVKDDGRFDVLSTAAWHGVDLNRTEEEAWEGIHPAARRSVRKARRNGVEVRIEASDDALRAFYDLHLRVRKAKYRLLAQPFEFFERLRTEFGDNFALMLAVHDDRLIAGTLYLQWQGVLYYKFNASLPEALLLRPNDLLTWEGIRYGQNLGLAAFDFGVSDTDQLGLIRYKQKYATNEGTVHRLVAGSEDPTAPAVDQLLSRLTHTLTGADVPDSVTEKVGTELYRLFC